MVKRQKFLVKWRIDYPSGKSWYDYKIVIAVTERGAEDVVLWLYANYDITIISVKNTGEYIGGYIEPSRQVLGDY